MSINTHRKSRVSPEYVLLGFLYKNPSHGYELHRRLVCEFGTTWHISQSQTYNIIKRLESRGFIFSVQVLQEKLPDRQLLHLSETGVQRFLDWLNTTTDCSVHAIRVEFISRLYFTQLYFPKHTQDVIQKQMDIVAQGLQKLSELQANTSEDQRFNRLALGMRIRQLKSIFNWLEDCRVEFATGDL